MVWVIIPQGIRESKKRMPFLNVLAQQHLIDWSVGEIAIKVDTIKTIVV
jgi:hypothetical protein